MIESNSTLLDKLSGKMYSGRPKEGTKGFGYFYNTRTKKPLCNFALINDKAVITDLDCAPKGPDFSNFKAIIPDSSMPTYFQRLSIALPKYITDQSSETTFVVFFVSILTKIRFFIP